MSSLAYSRTGSARHSSKAVTRAAAGESASQGGVGEALGDALFMLIHPICYRRLVRALGRRRDEAHKLGGMVTWLERRLAEQGVEAQVKGRLKCPGSIHRKMRRRGIPLEKVHDLRGIRVIVDDEKSCYRVLAFVHRWCDEIPNLLDDYIAFPKENGYRSLHTVVQARGGEFEVQIRSWAMHQVAERGSAAHWRYKGASARDGTRTERVTI